MSALPLLSAVTFSQMAPMWHAVGYVRNQMPGLLKSSLCRTTSGWRSCTRRACCASSAASTGAQPHQRSRLPRPPRKQTCWPGPRMGGAGRKAPLSVKGATSNSMEPLVHEHISMTHDGAFVHVTTNVGRGYLCMQREGRSPSVEAAYSERLIMQNKRKVGLSTTREAANFGWLIMQNKHDVILGAMPCKQGQSSSLLNT